MNFAAIINLLAAPPDIQLRFLHPVPQDAADPDFMRGDNVYRMLLLYSRSCAVYEGGGGSEGVDSWLRRTQLPESLIADRANPAGQAIRHLSTAIDMIEQLGRDFLFTAHGLRSAPEWKLVRHLAVAVLEQTGWPRELVYSSFNELWDALGNGVIEC